jgi:arylsulfatase A-like enzyme
VKKNSLVFIVLFLFVSVLFGASVHAKEKPNVIFIMADDVGYEALGCYGGESYSTTHLDALAKSGMQAMHCYSMPVCHPTRVAFLSGKYPRRVGSPKWGTFPVELEKQTMAHMMKAAGYMTVVTGKWQLAFLKDDPRQPHRMGFDEYCVFGWHEGPRYHEPMIYQNGVVNRDAKKEFGPNVYREYLESFISKSVKKEKPFFAFYSMSLCHDVTDDLSQPVPVSPSGKYLTYSEMVSEMDRQIGLLVRYLEKSGLRDNTMLVFTTDNGTPTQVISYPEGDKLIRSPVFSKYNGKSIQGGKGKLDDTGTRVPLIVSWPSVIAPGSRTDAMIDMTDFFATSVELSKVKSIYAIDGLSFMPALLGKESQRTWAYSERKGRWWVRDQYFKLYDDGKFVEVSNSEFGMEFEIKINRSAKQQAAFNKLQKAQNYMTFH